jgi:putative ABC transport system permease protein
MYIGESLRTTLTEIWAHKMRSLLTLFGVVLGTMAVVTMVSLIEAVKVEIWNGFDSLGLRGVLFVSTEAPTSNLDVKRSHLSEGLRREDAAGLVEASDQITSAAPVSYTQQVIAWGDASQSIRITATTPQYAVVFDRRAEKGRYISDLDLKRKRRVVVIGHFLVEELFGSHDAIGQWVRIGDHRFEVVGIGERVGNEMINDGWSRREMEGATIPLTTMQSLFGGGDRIPLLIVGRGFRNRKCRSGDPRGRRTDRRAAPRMDDRPFRDLGDLTGCWRGRHLLGAPDLARRASL